MSYGTTHPYGCTCMACKYGLNQYRLGVPFQDDNEIRRQLLEITARLKKSETSLSLEIAAHNATKSKLAYAEKLFEMIGSGNKSPDVVAKAAKRKAPRTVAKRKPTKAAGKRK